MNARQSGTGDRVILEGQITSWVFRSENDSGWGVAVFRDQNGRSHKLAGKLTHCQEGKSYRMAGVEETNRYGVTVKVSSCIGIEPRGATGVRSYLETLPGIGPVSAAALVDNAGPDGAIRLLEEGSLDEIKRAGARLSEDKLHSLREAMKADKCSRESELQIREMLGEIATDSLVRKIREQFGETAVDRIKQSPWATLTKLPGIGFLRADAIALRVGANTESIDRLRAACLFAIEQSCDDGDTAHRSIEVVEKAAALLGFGGERANQRATEGLLSLLESGDVIESAPDVVQLRVHAIAERDIADDLARKMRCAVRDHEFGAVPPDPSLKPDQVAALDVIRRAGRGGVAVLTGAPGTGKTTMVRSVFPWFGTGRIALCAPTGKAAKRLSDQAGIQAVTIHRVLEPMPRATQDGGVSFEFGKNSDNPIDADLVVVDEASMVDVELFRRLVAAIARSTFLLIVGDPDQLPSVGPGAVLRDLIDSGIVPHASLTEIKRTNPGELLQSIHRVRAGRWSVVENRPDQDLVTVPVQTEPQAVATIADLYLNRLPAMLAKRQDPSKPVVPEHEIQILVPWRDRDGMSVRTVNESIQAQRVALGQVEQVNNFPIGRGDKVIQTRNDYKLGIVNGDQGIVRQVTQIAPADDPDGKPVWHYVVEFVGYADPIAIPAIGCGLDLAYAVTIHKAQGSEWPVIVIPSVGTSSPFYDRGLLYTALSRAQRMGVIVGRQDGLPSVCQRVGAKNRRTMLGHNLTHQNEQAPTSVGGAPS